MLFDDRFVEKKKVFIDKDNTSKSFFELKI